MLFDLWDLKFYGRWNKWIYRPSSYSFHGAGNRSVSSFYKTFPTPHNKSDQSTKMVRIVIKSLAVIAYMSLDLSRQCSAGMLINQHQESPAKDESAFRNDVKLACCTVICDKSELDKFCWCGTIDSSKLKQLLTERGVKDTPKLDEIKSLIMPVVSEWKDIELELENLCELEKKAEGNPKDNEGNHILL